MQRLTLTQFLGPPHPIHHVNNLYPIKHRALYPAISGLFSRFVPLFEQILLDALNAELPLPITEIRISGTATPRT